MPTPAWTCISPSFTEGGAQHDAGVYFAAGVEIVDSAA